MIIRIVRLFTLDILTDWLRGADQADRRQAVRPHILRSFLNCVDVINKLCLTDVIDGVIHLLHSTEVHEIVSQ